jgi:hypothetical protein
MSSIECVTLTGETKSILSQQITFHPAAESLTPNSY